MMATGAWRLWMTVIIVGFCLSACGGDSEPPQKAPLQLKTLHQPKPPIIEAKPYVVVRKHDNSFPGRKRLVFGISSAAETTHGRSSTVVQAARDLQKSTSADLVEVQLYPSEKLATAGGNYTAKALFAPDGGGYSGDQGWKWDVCVSSETYTKKDIELEEAWFENQNRFRLPNGAVDEPKLKRFLSKKLGLPIAVIAPPFLYPDMTVNVN